MGDPKSGASWTVLKFIENLSNMVVRDAIASTLAPLLAGYENLTLIRVHVRCYKYVIAELARRTDGHCTVMYLFCTPTTNLNP